MAHPLPAPRTDDPRRGRFFFRLLGTRIAQRRKAQDLTQAQLGELVGVTQQQIASFETGRRRMPISTLPLLAKALGTSIEELIGEPAKPGKRGPAPKLQQQLERLSRLPKAQKNSSARSSTRCWHKPTDNCIAINDKARERGPCAVRDRINSLRPLKVD